MPMATMHPRFGPMFPNRARNFRGFGAGEELIVSSAQAIDAFKRAVCSKQAAGYRLGLSEIIGIGSTVIEQAKSQGMSMATAGTLVAMFASMAYDMYQNGMNCAAVPNPTQAPAQPPPPQPKPASASSGSGALIALAVAGALVGAAALSR